MASDNQVSSILLLILIGLAIYFLLNPYEGFKNKMEFFDDLSMDYNGSDDYNFSDFSDSVESDSSNSVVDTSVNTIPVSNSDPIVNAPIVNAPIVNAPMVSAPMVSAPMVSAPVVDNSVSMQYIGGSDDNYSGLVLNSEPNISENLLSEIINESATGSNPTLFEPKNVLPIDYSMINSNQMSSNVPVSSNNIDSIANFDPNDDDYFYNGTDLSSAFKNSLPANANPNTIDFKKNNVDKYNAKDFLPKEVNDEWFETDFSLAKYQLNDDNLINTEKYIIGINTVGESLKNASYDIRGTIPNPKFIVSPWNNSTYEPDFNLKPLC
jgi:hypothetical protein